MAGAHPTLEDLAKTLKTGERLMGLDLGSKTIGIAISDVTRQIATPIETIRRSKFSADAAQLLALAARENAAAIILGMPMNMDGSEGARAQSTRAFVRNLAKLSPLPVILWDERLSTAAVERMLIEADRSRARRREIVDKLAAAYILQGALDRLAQLARK
jgi:putative pre-16S rRNA nuclease